MIFNHILLDWQRKELFYSLKYSNVPWQYKSLLRIFCYSFPDLAIWFWKGTDDFSVILHISWPFLFETVNIPFKCIWTQTIFWNLDKIFSENGQSGGYFYAKIAISGTPTSRSEFKEMYFDDILWFINILGPPNRLFSIATKRWRLEWFM